MMLFCVSSSTLVIFLLYVFLHVIFKVTQMLPTVHITLQFDTCQPNSHLLTSI
jgi:hypothetical protein